MRNVIFIFLMVTLSNCQQTNQPSNTAINASGFDTNDLKELETLYKEAGALEFIRSMIVWKDEKIISEGYFQPYAPDSLDHIRSVTKSIISILVGIAIDKQLIRSVHDPISMYIGEKVSGYSLDKQQIRIKDLLTMSAGFQWNESNLETFNNWVRSSNPFDHVFSRDLVVKPGTAFNYNSGLPHILSIIISNVSGMNTLAFAQKFLFEPLGIEQVRWSKLSDGYYNGGAGLELKPSDLLKIGIVMLNMGKYYQHRIVTGQWVESSFEKHILVMEIPGRGKSWYGYLWWVTEVDEMEFIQAKGYGGQYLGIIPNHQLVFSITSQWQNLQGRGTTYIKELDKVLAGASKMLLEVDLNR